MFYDENDTGMGTQDEENKDSDTQTTETSDEM